MKYELFPLQDRIIVKPLSTSIGAENMIVLPSREGGTDNNMGRVIAIGEGIRFPDGNVYPPKVKVGDTVVFGKYAGTEMVVGADPPIMIMRESDIFCIVIQID